MKLRLVFSTCLLFFWCIANAQVKVPAQLIGNWINEKNKTWGYGFYEKFAIYESDFWEYKSISRKNDHVEIILKKGDKTEKLNINLPKKTAESVSIALNNVKPGIYKLNQTGYAPYRDVDNRPIPNKGYKSDTVTIIGYYRNLEQFKKEAGPRMPSGPFKVSVPNIILDKSVEYFADFDSLGRFKIKFPVLNTQEVYVDWGRLMKVDVVEPGETLFLFADMGDFIPNPEELSKNGWEGFRNKPKQVVYMGKEARLHNELAHYTSSSAHFYKGDLGSKPSDTDFLVAANANYEARKNHLKNYISSRPALSKKFQDYQFAHEKYQLAFHLLQHRFDKRGEENIAFDKGYLDFVQANIKLDEELPFTLIREISSFTRDYIGYHSEISMAYNDKETGKIKYKRTRLGSEDVFRTFKGSTLFTKEDHKVLADMAKIEADILPILEGMKDTTGARALIKPYSKTIKSYQALQERPDIKDAIAENLSELFSQKLMARELKQIDSLIQNPILRQLLIARELNQTMTQNMVPLSENSLTLFNNQITNSAIKVYISAIHKHYETISNKKISYLASLKNTAHLKEAKDADKLFKELVSPYKGKIIYVDFWGTWCGPCKEQMPYMKDVKKELAGKDVVFMYFANNSPEKSWMNVIKQMNLAGENVVHYRLPTEQQAMIERKFSVNSFPSYFIIGKDGSLLQDDAPRPQMKDELVSLINKYLTN